MSYSMNILYTLFNRIFHCKHVCVCLCDYEHCIYLHGHTHTHATCVYVSLCVSVCALVQWNILHALENLK